MKPLRILITAGPTLEPIDPVRFISNRSTGHIGNELARAAKKRKHKVTLIIGPATLKPPRGIKLLHIETARELYRAVHKALKGADVLIMASAVCDFRTARFSGKKINSKRKITLKLAKNPDILKSIAKKERAEKLIVGFALETGNLLKNAAKKLKDKRLDLIIANKMGRKSGPFGKGAKSVCLIGKNGSVQRLKNTPKNRIAGAILDTIEELCYTQF